MTQRLLQLLLVFAILICGLLLPTTESFVGVTSTVTTRTTTTRTTSATGRFQATASSSGPYDLAVIGAGVVGVNSAMVAAQAPYLKRVVLIDAPTASGKLMVGDNDLSIGAPTGLFSKALRDTSKRINVNTLRGMGLREDSVWNEIISNCVELASSNAQDIRRQLDVAGVSYKRGFCSFADDDSYRGGDSSSSRRPHSLFITNGDNMETVLASKVLIATGSKPFRPSGIPFDGQRVFDSDSINSLSFLPRSIAITGSGIIAVEFAKIFRNLGADVTLIIRDQVPRNALMKIGLDKDVAATLVADLVRSGIKIARGQQVRRFEIPTMPRAPLKVFLEAVGGSGGSSEETELRCDAYLAAVGRKPNSDRLNLQAMGVEVDEYGGVVVDSNLCSSVPNVYAAGDVLGRPFLASVGVAQGRAAITGMFESDRAARDAPPVVPQCEEGDVSCVADGISASGTSFDPASLASNPFAFPTGVWSSPEASYYGLTTEQAKKMGIDAGEGIALYCECLRGRVFSPNGLLKIVFEKPAGRILGVHVCGDDACELIHYGMELVKSRRTVLEINDSLYSAVTFHEMYKIAAQAALDEAGARKRRAAAGAALAKRNRQRRDQREG